jgi:hypothetical protein
MLQISSMSSLSLGQWQRPVVPRDERLCVRCTRYAIEGELHVLFVCPAYQQIRLQHGSNWFVGLGISCSLQSGSLTREPGKVSKFVNQEPKVVAPFVAECLHIHWQSEDDPLPYGNVHDTFSSDCSPSALDSIGWDWH